MESLRVFASIQCDLSLNAIARHFTTPLSTDLNEDALHLSSDQLRMSIVECSVGEFLMRGEVEDFAYLEQHVLASIKAFTQDLHMDIFEEDGRLLKRLSTI